MTLERYLLYENLFLNLQQGSHRTRNHDLDMEIELAYLEVGLYFLCACQSSELKESDTSARDIF